MADAMVTARMSSEKKEAGNRILEQMGTNASQAVNRLYDYVIEKRELRFSIGKKGGAIRRRKSPKRSPGSTAFPRKGPRDAFQI